ncbi:dual oxidase maturation factor 1-like [Ambystoma mexicanum]|uniref:dual oxidase maturation factor 1-like n=1 Tax=Ambystoma mexicanum TaxID=8296 RepID=UPI0037E7B483
MGWRDRTFPFYPQQRVPFIFDVASLEIIIVFLASACTFIIILPGIRGKARPFWLLRVLSSLFIGAVILAVNFTSNWETGSVNVNTTYKAFSNIMMNVDVGLRVGLQGLNITLTGKPIHQMNETIDYNEKFEWTLGKHFDEDYLEALERGLPDPILYVAEKFTMKSPCAVQSQYRVAAYYASAMMWLAFATWIISNILFTMPNVHYGAYLILATGACMILSLISFSAVRDAPSCTIVFGSSTLKTAFAGSFYLTLVTGVACFLIGLVLLLLESIQPTLVARLFNLAEVEVIEEDEEDDLSDQQSHSEDCSSQTIPLHDMA